MRRNILPIIIVLLSGVLAFAHSGATGVVKERMEAMKEISASMKAVGSMLRGKADYDQKNAMEAADVIKSHALMLPDLFPEQSLDKPSEALPAIWQNWEEFTAINDEMKSAAENLSQLASNAESIDELGPAFKTIGKTCASCHEKFRLKK